MSTRATRRASQAEPDMAALAPRDRLIVAQAVCELGPDWPAVAKLLAKHPLLSHPKNFFTAQSCQSIYARLLQEAELDDTEETAVQSQTVARRYFVSHFDELRVLVKTEEEKFKSLTTEIEQIKAGKWKTDPERTATAEITPKVEELELEAEPTPPPELKLDDDDASSDDEPLHATRTRAARQRASGKARVRKKSVVSSARADSEAAPNETDVEMEQPDTPGESPAPGPARRSKRKASTLDPPENLRDQKRAREASEPAIDEEASSSSGRVRRRGGGDPEAAAIRRFQSIIVPLHNRITTLKDGNIFQSPIKATEAPDYRDIVRRPVDLRTIRQRVKDGAITNSLEYRRDIYLMFANAIMYNRPGSSVYKMGETMRDDSEQLINDFLNTEATLLHRERMQ